MSGTYRRLGPGRYQLVVRRGDGPAGIRRSAGQDIAIDIEGGTREFAVREEERVYFWWRGPSPGEGVRLEKRGVRARPYAISRRGAGPVPAGR